MAKEPPRDAKTEVLGERTLYSSDWITLALVDVRPPDGRRFEHHVVRLRPVAIAALLNDANELLMLWRHRFAVDEWGYELLGGLVEVGEDTAAAAAREAEEESGWRPIGEPEHLVHFQPLPGMVDSAIDIYLWRTFERVGRPTDLEEAGEIVWMPLDRVPGLVGSGRVLGAGTIAAILQILAINCGVTFKPASAPSD
jgi:8-oxo-dGTP pyrophosphatase MutT (NUDIX family)